MKRRTRIILSAITIVLTSIIMYCMWSKPATEPEKEKMYQVAEFVANSYRDSKTIPEVGKEFILDTKYINQGKDSYFRVQYKREFLIVFRNDMEKARFTDATIFDNLIMLLIIGAAIGFSSYGIYLVICKIVNRNNTDNNIRIQEE